MIAVEKDKEPEDRSIHQPILDAVNFTDTPAVKAAIKRGLAMGLSAEAIQSSLGVPASAVQAVQQE